MFDFNKMIETFHNFPKDLKKGFIVFAIGWGLHFISLYLISYGIMAPEDIKVEFKGLTQNEIMLWIGMCVVLFYSLLNSKSWAKNLCILFCVMAIIYYCFFTYLCYATKQWPLVAICFANMCLFAASGYYFTLKSTTTFFKDSLDEERKVLDEKAKEKMKEFEDKQLKIKERFKKTK